MLSSKGQDNALVLDKIKRENFLRSRRWDKLKTFLPIAGLFHVWLVAKLMMRSKRISDPDWAVNRFRESTQELLAAKATEKEPKLRRFFVRMAELNDIGIDQVQTIKESRKLQNECFDLKRSVVWEESQDMADQFLQTAAKLYDVREHLVDVSKKKMDKQREVIDAIEHLDGLSKKDLTELALAQAIDFVMGTRIVTSLKLGDISGKYIAKQVQKSFMSPRILNRTIQLTEFCQERYREWKDRPSLV